MLALMIASGIGISLTPDRRKGDVELWTFARMHALMYDPLLARWNADRPDDTVEMTLFAEGALERRLLSSFMARTAVADLIEVERKMAGRAFSGPADAVGFVDLTDRLRDAGLLDQINPASFSPWTSRGRIFGLPHDVHPVMLVYRADIVDRLGIDLSGVETWDDFFRAMAPVMTDENGDGEPDRYILSLWETHPDAIEVLMLQAGGRFFNEEGEPDIASEINARTIATIVSWTTGPGRLTADAMPFSASGNKLKLDGYVVADLMPDWMCNIWKNEMPQLSGKVRVMPLPAWDRGGRRTSVWGGTMLGISTSARNPDACWDVAQHLYLSKSLAQELYRTGDIITPFRAHWDDAVFDEPDPYFQGQRKGRMFIELAGDVPLRSSSPYNTIARERVRDATVSLASYARRTRTYDAESLRPEAMRLLVEAQAAVERLLNRNQFIKEPQ